MTNETRNTNCAVYPGQVRFGVYGDGKFLVGCTDSRTASRIMDRLAMDVKAGRSSWKSIDIRQISGTITNRRIAG